MKIPILIEAIEGNRFRARAGEPFAMSAEGATRIDAYENLQILIRERLRAADLLTLDLDAEGLGVLCAGSLAQDPLAAEWQEIMAENRRREDAGER